MTRKKLSSENLIKELQAVAIESAGRLARADALFESMGDAAITTDEKGKINRVNQAALDLFSYSEEELMGAWYPRVIVALDSRGRPIPTIERPISRAFLSGQAIHDRFFYKRRNGSLLPLAITVAPIMLNGRPLGAIKVFRDIRKEMEVDRMKSEFISLASHQLRTPLTAINLDVHMLAEGYLGDLTDEQKQALQTVLFSVDRMNELISTLLNITRLEAGRLSVIPKTVQPISLVNEIVQEQSSNAGEKRLKIIKHSPKRLSAITTDPLLLKETLANLLSNAIKYTPADGTITVRLASRGPNLLFCVEDTGYGIPLSEQPRIFSKFYRGSNITYREAVGTGLGLYMIKAVVDALEGDIWFESKEGQGTTFYVSLPKAGPVPRKGITALEPTLPHGV